MFETNFVRKIKVKHGLRHALRAYADSVNLKFYQLQHDAINELIFHRLECQRQGKQIEYFMSPYEGDDLNIRISEQLAARIRRIATVDRCHVNRFLYTALVMYAIKRKLVSVHFNMQDLPIVGLERV
jgi:predicted HicB family RNase H-like nuclease